MQSWYANPALDGSPELLERRDGAFDSEAAAAVMTALNGDTRDLQVLNVPNDGALPDMLIDAVVAIDHSSSPNGRSLDGPPSAAREPVGARSRAAAGLQDAILGANGACLPRFASSHD